jgi:hypothetical protein
MIMLWASDVYSAVGVGSRGIGLVVGVRSRRDELTGWDDATWASGGGIDARITVRKF